MWLTRALPRGYHVFGRRRIVWHISNLGAARCKTFKSGIWSMTLMLFWICRWAGWAGGTKGSFVVGVPETFELKQSKLSCCEINVRVDDRCNWLLIDCPHFKVWSSKPIPFLPQSCCCFRCPLPFAVTMSVTLYFGKQASWVDFAFLALACLFQCQCGRELGNALAEACCSDQEFCWSLCSAGWLDEMSVAHMMLLNSSNISELTVRDL